MLKTKKLKRSVRLAYLANGTSSPCRVFLPHMRVLSTAFDTDFCLDVSGEAPAARELLSCVRKSLEREGFLSTTMPFSSGGSLLCKGPVLSYNHITRCDESEEPVIVSSEGVLLNGEGEEANPIAEGDVVSVEASVEIVHEDGSARVLLVPFYVSLDKKKV